MTLNELSSVMRGAGIAGAGGAGFPSYAKLNPAADTLILNCAECEPLLKLHRQVLAKYAEEILWTLNEMAEALGADRVIVATKSAYRETVSSVEKAKKAYPKISLHLLPEVYPSGDEVITIYETTGRVVRPGALPISVGCIVYNTETVYNIYRALKDGSPVTAKFITVAGEAAAPATFRAPLGMTYGELLRLAGGATVSDYRLVGGGPMTGRLVKETDVVTKTSNAVLVLPADHYVISRKSASVKIDIHRAMAACCQCRMCTDLCSRYLLGHPIEPHLFMRGIASGVTADVKPFLNTMYCSMCGLCEMYSCGQGLSPRTLIGEYKNGLREKGIKADPDAVLRPVDPNRAGRIVPSARLTARLGLARYDVPAPLDETPLTPESVKILFRQSIGVPAVPTVKPGDRVKAGDVLALAADGKLSVPVHASVTGIVTEVMGDYAILHT